MRTCGWVWLALPGLLAAMPAGAGEIRAVGTLGNSGRAGEALVRVTPHPGGQLPTGAAVGEDLTVYLGAGRGVNHLALSGELLERHALEPKGAAVDSATFAVLNGTLYFLARPVASKRAYALFAMPMRRGAVARPLDLKLPPRRRGHVGYVLAPQPLDGRLVLAGEAPAGEGVDVHLIDPAAGKITKAFSLPAGTPHGAAVDARRRIVYLGAEAIHALRPDGSPAAAGFPIPCMKTPAIPTSFRGTISLAGGAIWDAAWYGFLSRHGTDGRNAPGRVVEWHHELGFPKQIVSLGRTHERLDPLLITTATPAALYYAHWDRRRMQLRPVRRLGCLPNIYALGLSPGGWITVASATCQLWWRWDDAASAPPRAAKLHVATTTPFFFEGRCLAVAAQYNIAGRGPRCLTIFTPQVGNRNEARRHQDVKLPCKEPAGLAVRPAAGRGRTDLFLTDGDARCIWRGGLSLGNLRPEGSWQRLALEGCELKAPGDVVALTDGRLLLADAGRVLLLARSGPAYRLVWALSALGEGPAARFGRHLRLAVDGQWMLLADTDRHRVLWLDWPRRQLLGTFGRTDTPGDDLAHVNRPTLVSLRAGRAVVADTANQRVLKLVLAP